MQLRKEKAREASLRVVDIDIHKEKVDETSIQRNALQYIYYK